MQKLLPLAFVLASLLFLPYFEKEPPAPEPIRNGALEALQWMADVQTYPTGELPAEAHYAAWLKARRLPAMTASSRSTDPWESMGPHNRGGRMLSVTFNPLNPRTIYAGSASGGVFRSYSAGEGAQAWERLELGFPVLGVSSIAFPKDDSTTIFVGTGEVYNHNATGTGAAYRNTRGSAGIGVLRSQDGGQTWHLSLDFSYAQSKGVWEVVVAPSDPNRVYAATTDGVYRSDDGGDSWSWILDISMATDLVVHPADADRVVVACGNFLTTGYGLYRTTNGGTSWQKVISNGVPAVYRGKAQLAMAPSDPNVLYASFGDGFTTSEGASWLCRSLDFGLTWQLRSTKDYSKWQGWFAHDVAVSPDNPDRIVVIGIEIWRSEDGGLTLTQTSTGGTGFSNPPPQGPDGVATYVHSDAHDVIFHPAEPNSLFICSDGGIHRSDDFASTFSSRNGGLQTAQFYNGFSTSGSDPIFCIGGLQDNNTIFWNGDLTWTRIGGGDGSWTAIHPANDNIWFISSQSLNVRRTTNGGSGFSSMVIPSSSPVSFIAPYVLSPANPSVMYAGSALVSRSDNGGDTWLATNNGDPLDGNPMLSMDASHQNQDVVYVASAPYLSKRSGVFVTLDGGASWKNITGSLPDRFPMDIAVDPTDDAVACVTWSGFGTGHLFRTTDYGTTWEDITGSLPDVPTSAVIIDPLFPDNIYVGNDLGVFASVDNGASWINYSEGLTDAVMVFDLKISANRKLRAATHGSGAFERDLLEMPYVATTEQNQLASAVSLFPNPASDWVEVRFINPLSGTVHFSLRDQNGRLVQPLSTAFFTEGAQQQRFNLPPLSGGWYTIALRTPAGETAAKLLVNHGG